MLPPVALMTAFKRFIIDLIKFLTMFFCYHAHSSNKAIHFEFLDGGRDCISAPNSLFELVGSIGSRAGLSAGPSAGQSIVGTPTSKKHRVVVEVWQRAL